MQHRLYSVCVVAAAPCVHIQVDTRIKVTGLGRHFAGGGGGGGAVQCLRESEGVVVVNVTDSVTKR